METRLLLSMTMMSPMPGPSLLGATEVTAASVVTAVDDQGPLFRTDEDTPFTTGDVLVNDMGAENQITTSEYRVTIEQPTSTTSTVGFSTAAVTADAADGSLGGTIELNSQGAFSNFSAGIQARILFEVVIDDIIITGPTPQVETAITFDLAGLYDGAGLNLTDALTNVIGNITFKGPDGAGNTFQAFRTIDPDTSPPSGSVV